MFINRKKELQSLISVITKNDTSLINMYGPRRIGKTSILKELVKSVDKNITAVYCFLKSKFKFNE